MYSEIRGAVPKISILLARNIVNQAWREIREKNLWSFNLVDTGIVTPALVTTGTCTTTLGSATIQFDLVQAVPALNASTLAYPLSPITTRQFRTGNVAGISGIYNIIQYDPVGGSATLDRVMVDPPGTNAAFAVLQAYYAAPYQDFLVWLSVRNMQMFLDMILTETRAGIDERDPQRSWYQFPTHVVPYATDTRGQGTANASATLGYPLYEFWGLPTAPFSYSCYGLRRGTPLVNPSDTLPIQVGEDCVKELSKYYAYQWAEANRDIAPRSTGPDFKFLMKEAEDKHKELLSMYRRQDKEFCNNWFSARTPGMASKAFGYYNTLASVAGPYSQM